MHTSSSRLFSALAFGGLLALGSACAGVDDTTSGESEDELRQQTAACANKTCGDTCTVCNGRPGCVETAVLKACNAQGRCTPGAPMCSAVDAGPAPSACAGKKCGDSCSTCTGEICPAVVEACDGQGRCTPAIPMCSPEDAGPAPSPCAGKKCGDTCTTCTGPVCPAVVETCDAKGTCGLAAPMCTAEDAGAGYQPCGGKKCGDACTQCPPGKPDCFETAVLKVCQADGACAPTWPACGARN